LHKKSKIEIIGSKLALDENSTLFGRSDEFLSPYGLSLEISWFFHNFSFTEIASPKRQAPSRNILTLQWHFTFIFNNFWWTISLVIFCLFRDTIGCAKPTYSDLFRISELYCLNFYIQAPIFLSKLISYNYIMLKKLIQYCATDIFIQISELKLIILEPVQT
jgi:hypothetical protein